MKQIKQNKIKEIKTILNNNSKGITLNLNGKIANNKKGFYCSITNNIFKTITYKNIYTILNKAYEINKAKKIKVYIGFWKDSKTNKSYLDLSLRFLNKNKALGIAKKYEQKAIFNLNNFQEIYV